MKIKERLFLIIIGFIIGALLTAAVGAGLYFLSQKMPLIKKMSKKLSSVFDFNIKLGGANQVVHEFAEDLPVAAGKSFGRYNQLTFELFRGGTFVIDKKSKMAVQKSDHYGDVALIRSTHPLPKTYKVSVVVGEIDYGLENIEGLSPDPDYSEGPLNENGCYLLAITDKEPSGHHTNTWWHQHRKAVIDVDNNVWGHGMPNPIFMVYFDKSNRLRAFDGTSNSWGSEWQKGFTYDPQEWYKIEIEKTSKHFILRVYTERGKLLKEAKADLKDIWHEDEYHADYFVVGDPHENYYRGSMKIKSISMPVRK